MDEVNRIKEVLPDFEDLVNINTAPEARQSNILLETAEWNLLSLINGRNTVDDIVRRSSLPRVKALQKLAGLKLAGLVTTGKKTDKEPDRLESMINRVTGLMDDYLQQKKQNPVEEKTSMQMIDTDPENRLEKIDIATELMGDQN